jgi:hypothetical protein
MLTNKTLHLFSLRPYGRVVLLALLLTAGCADKTSPEPSIGDAQKAFASGDFAQTVSISDKLIALGKTSGEAHFLVARVRTRQGNPDGAIDALEAALVAGLPNKQVIVTSDEFLSLSQNPRYLMLLEKYGIESGSDNSSTGPRIKAGDIEIEL